jgi:hypothetical protein
MSFFKRLFGVSAGNSTEHAREIEHEGYLIRPAPLKENGQFRLVAIISKEIDGERRKHKLIRADLFATADEAEDAAIRKAKIVIREQGDDLFSV